MADLTQTPGSVVANAVALQQRTGTSGQAINAGMPLWLNNDDGNWYQAAGGNINAAGQYGVRIALNSTPGPNQPVQLFVSGQLNLGATLTSGETYCVSTNTGRICKFTEVNTGNFTTVLGVAQNTSFIQTPSGGAFAAGVARS